MPILTSFFPLCLLLYLFPLVVVKFIMLMKPRRNDGILYEDLGHLFNITLMLSDGQVQPKRCRRFYPPY